MDKKKKYYIFSLDMIYLNIFSFFLFFIFFFVAYLINKNLLIDSFEYVFSANRMFLSFVLIFGYLVLHELLHSFGYYLYGAKYKNIVYGVELEKGIFYCLCKQNVSRKNILNSLFFPLFYIGIVTYIISLIFEFKYLLVLSIFNLSGCCGDIITFIYMWKLNRNIEFSEFDSTTSFAIYADYDVSNIKHTGLDYVGVKERLVRKDKRKIMVSKFSYIILILFFVCGIFLF